MNKYVAEVDKDVKAREKWKRGITARLLRNYADSLKERLEHGEVCVDSDLHHVLLRAAMLLEEYCPEVIEHERQRKALLEGSSE